MSDNLFSTVNSRYRTSFCVTVSMMVPKAGIVEILTELKTAGEQVNTSTIYCCRVPLSGAFQIRMTQILSAKRYSARRLK